MSVVKFENDYVKLKLYPNPVIDELNVTSLTDDIYSVMVTNSVGKIMYETEQVNSSLSIDVLLPE